MYPMCIRGVSEIDTRGYSLTRPIRRKSLNAGGYADTHGYNVSICIHMTWIHFWIRTCIHGLHAYPWIRRYALIRHGVSIKDTADTHDVSVYRSVVIAVSMDTQLYPWIQACISVSKRIHKCIHGYAMDTPWIHHRSTTNRRIRRVSARTHDMPMDTQLYPWIPKWRTHGYRLVSAYPWYPSWIRHGYAMDTP